MKCNLKTYSLFYDLSEEKAEPKKEQDFILLEKIAENKKFPKNLQKSACVCEITKKEATLCLSFYENGKTEITFKEEDLCKITVKRDGEASSLMSFEKGKVTKGVYKTPYGDIDFLLYTSFVKNTLLSDGKIEITYVMCLGGKQTQKTIFKLEVNE